MTEFARAPVFCKVKEAPYSFRHIGCTLLKVAPTTIFVKARVAILGACRRRQRDEEHVCRFVKVPRVDGGEGALEAGFLALRGKGLLWQAEEINHHADSAAPRVHLGLIQHRLEKRQDPS